MKKIFMNLHGKVKYLLFVIMALGGIVLLYIIRGQYVPDWKEEGVTSEEQCISVIHGGIEVLCTIGIRMRMEQEIQNIYNEMAPYGMAIEDARWFVKSYEVLPIPSSFLMPIQLDEWGLASIQTSNGRIDTAKVRIDSIYVGADAEELIADYHGRKQQPSEGTKFVVVEYSSTSSALEGYLDVRFCGLDGSKLKYDGNEYSQRTYDMLDAEVLDDDTYCEPVFAHRYVYFEVPRGCNEYMLVFGVYVGNREKACWVIGDNGI